MLGENTGGTGRTDHTKEGPAGSLILRHSPVSREDGDLWKAILLCGEPQLRGRPQVLAPAPQSDSRAGRAFISGEALGRWSAVLG